MARTLDSYDFPHAGRPAFIVPDEWLDGKINVLDEGTDYKAGSEKTLKNAVVKAGAVKGLKVTVDLSKVETEKMIVVQAAPKTPKVAKVAGAEKSAPKKKLSAV